MANLVTNIQQIVKERPDATAVHFMGRDISYEELWSLTGRFAAALHEADVTPGDRVAIYAPNLPEWVVAFHGALRAGAVVVPMNPQYKARELRHLLSDSSAKAIVAFDKLVPLVNGIIDETDLSTVVSVGGAAEGAVEFDAFLADDEAPVVQRADDDLAVLPYTSGTTGTPKGVELTHGNVAGNARQLTEILPDGMRDDDRTMGVLPLFHIYGMNAVMNPVLFGGGAFHPLPTFDVEATVQHIADQEITIMNGVPAMYTAIINHPEAEAFDLSSLRICTVGGAGIPVAVLRRFEELYPVKVYEGYGLTETSPVTHFNSPNWGRRVGSIGKPIPGVESKVVDEDFNEVPRVKEGPVDESEVDLDEITGEIVISGPNVMKGYYGLPEANDEVFRDVDGTRWFHTGDIGYWDEDGYFYIADRKTHMILSKGYNVYPREIEDLLYEHDAVAEAAVVGVPNEEYGELVKAFIVPKSGADVTQDQIKQYCLDNLAAYKHPREIEFVDALPRTTTGKVQKFELA